MISNAWREEIIFGKEVSVLWSVFRSRPPGGRETEGLFETSL